MVVRERFPADIGAMIPGHTLTLVPALRLENLLPVELQFRAAAPDDAAAARASGTLAPADTRPFHEVRTRRSGLGFIRVSSGISSRAFCSGKRGGGRGALGEDRGLWVVVGAVRGRRGRGGGRWQLLQRETQAARSARPPPLPQRQGLRFQNRRYQGNSEIKLCANPNIQLRNDNTRSGAGAQVSISAAYWLVNRTGLPLVFRAEGGAGEAAGQFDEHEVARMVAPLLFAFAEADGGPTVAARLGRAVAPSAEVSRVSRGARSRGRLRTDDVAVVLPVWAGPRRVREEAGGARRRRSGRGRARVHHGRVGARRPRPLPPHQHRHAHAALPTAQQHLAPPAVRSEVHGHHVRKYRLTVHVVRWGPSIQGDAQNSIFKVWVFKQCIVLAET